VSNYFGLILKKCKKNIFFAKSSPFWSKFLSESGVIDARNDLLREFFAPNVQGIKGIRAICVAADSPTTLDIQTVSKYSKLDIFFVPFATHQCRASFFFYVGYDPTISRFLIFLQFGPIYAW